MQPLKENVWQDVKYSTIKNSEVLRIGEPIKGEVSSELNVALTAMGTTTAVFGVVVGFKDRAGNALELNKVTAGSDNQTAARVQAVWVPAFIPIEWRTVLNANAGTTTGSSGFGNFALGSADDDNPGRLNESSYVVFTTTASKQFFSFGLTGKDNRQVSGRFMSFVTGA